MLSPSPFHGRRFQSRRIPARAGLTVLLCLVAIVADRPGSGPGSLPDRVLLQADGHDPLECLLRRMLGLPCQDLEPEPDEPLPPEQPINPLA